MTRSFQPDEQGRDPQTGASYARWNGSAGGVNISSGGDLHISPNSVITGGNYNYPYHGSGAQGYDPRRGARPEYVAWGMPRKHFIWKYGALTSIRWSPRPGRRGFFDRLMELIICGARRSRR